MPRLNPFRPTSPIGPGMFVGRLREIDQLDQILLQAAAGEALHFALTGERGIGKSSLLLYMQELAKGALVPLQLNNRALRFVVVHTDINEGTSALGLMGRIELGLRKTLAEVDPGRSLLTQAWSFLQRIETSVGSIRPATKSADAEVLLDEFAFSLAETAKRLCESSQVDPMHFDGILILIDECDHAPMELRLGALLKLTIERLQRRAATRSCLGWRELQGSAKCLRAATSLRQGVSSGCIWSD